MQCLFLIIAVQTYIFQVVWMSQRYPPAKSMTEYEQFSIGPAPVRRGRDPHPNQPSSSVDRRTYTPASLSHSLQRNLHRCSPRELPGKRRSVIALVFAHPFPFCKHRHSASCRPRRQTVQEGRLPLWNATGMRRCTHQVQSLADRFIYIPVSARRIKVRSLLQCSQAVARTPLNWPFAVNARRVFPKQMIRDTEQGSVRLPSHFSFFF